MASIQLLQIRMNSPNPALYTDPFTFAFTVNVIDSLSEDLEVLFVWVGSADNPANDQKLEELIYGPLQLGTNVFVAEVPPPRYDIIPECDILGETLLLVSLRYCDDEFFRISYWVNVSYISPVDNSDVPLSICIDRIGRTLSEPSMLVTQINWHGNLIE